VDDDKHPHPVDVTVGSRVRRARLARGLSQGALAVRIGVTFQQVQKYENGSNRISASKLVEIADNLGVAASSFLDGLGLNSAQGSGPAQSRAPDVSNLVKLYAELPPPMRDTVLQLVNSLLETIEHSAPRRRRAAAGADADEVPAGR
jgi:transcriptional regulator with XRE-family HTH domain